MTGDIEAANKAGLNGMWLGSSVGGVVGAGTGYKYAVDNNLNPWNGNSNIVEPPQQLTPYQKGQEGVNRYIQEEILPNGGTVLRQEVTLEVNGVKVRVDIAADFNGTIQLIEVKNDPYADFTPNQKIAYPQMQGEVRVPVIPRGANASQIPQWQVGQPTTNYYLIIKKY